MSAANDYNPQIDLQRMIGSYRTIDELAGMLGLTPIQLGPLLAGIESRVSSSSEQEKVYRVTEQLVSAADDVRLGKNDWIDRLRSLKEGIAEINPPGLIDLRFEKGCLYVVYKKEIGSSAEYRQLMSINLDIPRTVIKPADTTALPEDVYVAIFGYGQSKDRYGVGITNKQSELARSKDIADPSAPKKAVDMPSKDTELPKAGKPRPTIDELVANLDSFIKGVKPGQGNETHLQVKVYLRLYRLEKEKGRPGPLEKAEEELRRLGERVLD